MTVVGESAGAGCIAALLAMPRADGLFRRAIVASMPGTFLSAELGAAVGAAIAAERGWAPRWPSWRRFPRTNWSWPGSRWPPGRMSLSSSGGSSRPHDTLFAPVVDGEVLPTTPWEALPHGAARGVDLVVGHTRDECRLFLVMRGRAGRITESEAARALAVFGPGQDGEKYRAAFPEASAEQLYVQVQTDWTFRMPAVALAEAQRPAAAGPICTSSRGRCRARAACSARVTASTCRCCSERSVPASARCCSAPSPRPRRTPPLTSSAGRGRRSPRPATRAGPDMTRSTA